MRNFILRFQALMINKKVFKHRLKITKRILSFNFVLVTKPKYFYNYIMSINCFYKYLVKIAIH